MQLEFYSTFYTKMFAARGPPRMGWCDKIELVFCLCNWNSTVRFTPKCSPPEDRQEWGGVTNGVTKWGDKMGRQNGVFDFELFRISRSSYPSCCPTKSINNYTIRT